MDIPNLKNLILENVPYEIVVYNRTPIPIFSSGVPDEIIQFEKNFFIGEDSVSDFLNKEIYEKRKNILERVFETGESEIVEEKLKDSEGNETFMKQYFHLINDASTEDSFVVRYGLDVTEFKEYEEKLKYIANHDPMTGLANRRLLYHRILDDKFRLSQNSNPKKSAIFLLDLDRFKVINDTLGHSAGDTLIISVSERLRELFEDIPDSVICRLGGDEFIVYLPGLSDDEALYNYSVEIIHSFRIPFELMNHTLFITTSVGVFQFEHNLTMDIEEIIHYADIAMYDAKENGRNKFSIYRPEMQSKTANQLNLESRLFKAFQNNEFVLLYQPKISTITKKIIGLEALLRWKDGDEVRSPDYFLGAAEESGLITKMGYQLFKKISEHLKKWNDESIDITVGINLSEKQFYDSYLIPQLEYAFQKYGIDGSSIELEINETIIMKDIDRSVDIIQKLKNRGIWVVIDDFGAGTSSLSKLKKCPVHTINIDKSFIQHITENYQDAAITGAIVSMANQLNIKVNVEGIENKKQLDFFRYLHCEIMQGFYFEKPMSYERINRLLIQKADYSSHFLSE
ncbi:MAG: EAL domain-containing protein [Leptospiraceae bacterium]|nr:EAL domain-containing protein [Leptospiraceae bacterium]